jgi:hypothetical protein
MITYIFPPTAVSVSVPPIAYTDSGVNTPVTPLAPLPVRSSFEAVDFLVNNYASTPVDSSTWVELTSSSPEVRRVQIFDSSGRTMLLGYGGSGSEAAYMVIIPGGNGIVDLLIPANTRLSLIADSTTASSGVFIMNLFG